MSETTLVDEGPVGEGSRIAGSYTYAGRDSFPLVTLVRGPHCRQVDCLVACFEEPIVAEHRSCAMADGGVDERMVEESRGMSGNPG